jgi:regulator of ribosome biosynthesis
MIFEEEGEPGPTIRSTSVDKPLELEFDVGNLLASDPNELNLKKVKSKNPSEYLKSLARENTQLLINQIWTLPFERVDDVVIAKLPKPTYVIPREKPAPKGKLMTKWEQYAKDKGISKRTKTKLVWDDLVKDWVPRYGYKRAAAEHEKDWVLEVPANADPFEDQFEKKSEAKSERVAKNELQRLKNIARARKVTVPSAGLTLTERPDKAELNQAMHVAKKATASLGKFQQKLPHEKPLKNTGKKRKFEPLVQESGKEKTMNLDVLDKIINKKPLLAVEKVVSRGLQKDRNEGGEDSFEDPQKRGRRGGGNKGTKNSKIKKGPARKGSFKKGRAAPRSKPKKKGR